MRIISETASKDLSGGTLSPVYGDITQGIRPDGAKMMPPMPYSYFAKMTDQDLDAVILYLRSLEPLPLPR